ncbi:MAG: hypothetical protein PHO86_03510, partial [Bacilli bacterium]|nr:hypothetical protein [Bacilli bacterium]
VVFAVIAMGATTYAWFTLTNTAKVEQFDIDVTSAEGIELSVVDGVWASTIDGSVIEGLTGVSGTKLTAVSTPNGYNEFTTLASLLADGTTATSDAVSGSHYVEFTINIRTRKISEAIYIDETNTTIVSPALSWQPDIAFAIDGSTSVTENSDPFNVYPDNSARMSFTGIGTSTVIYEKEATTDNNTSGMSSDWSKGALNYYKAKKGYTSTTAPTIPAYTTIDLGTANTAAITTTSDALNEAGWATTSVVVRIWLEGWDAECYNAIFNGQLQVKIAFTTTLPTIE